MIDESVLYELYYGKGVSKRGDCYEAYFSDACRYVFIGLFKSEAEAQENSIRRRIERFHQNISLIGETYETISESIYPKYFVSNSGKVINQFGKELIGSINRDGYRQIVICNKTVCVHRIIALSLLPNPNNYVCVNHIDGNKTNNKIENLEWCSHSQNTLHAYMNGLEKCPTGEDNHKHKLTWDDVTYIRSHFEKYSKEFGACALGRKFNVDKSTIMSVVNHKTWRNYD